jgi:acetate kinase
LNPTASAPSLLLNAGSSSLKCTLMEAADRQVIAHSVANWAGSVTHYEYRGPGGEEHKIHYHC